jgi:hypothetical protein
MKATEEVQNVEFSPEGEFVNISTSEGFRIISSDPEKKTSDNHLRGEFLFENKIRDFSL